MCITWQSSTGTLKFVIDGQWKRTETNLVPNFSTGIGYLVIGGFRGKLTQFNMWDEYIDLPLVNDLARSLTTGNVVPWPEVQLWRVGNVTKEDLSFCKLSGEKTFGNG